MTSVWPALWPPWKRTTTSARADSQSTSLPLPSSPHWAPTTVTLAMRYVSPPRRVDLAALRQGLGGKADQPLGQAKGAGRLDGPGGTIKARPSAGSRRRLGSHGSVG